MVSILIRISISCFGFTFIERPFPFAIHSLDPLICESRGHCKLKGRSQTERAGRPKRLPDLCARILLFAATV